MSDPLYRKELLRLAADAHGAGRLASPTATGTAYNPACGDKVTVDLVIDQGRIAGIAQETKACVLAQASASILGAALTGADAARVRQLKLEISAMLGSRGSTPAPPFESYAAFQGAVEFESRHRCVLLPLDAVLAAFDNSEASKTTWPQR
jgi:NifU-like protein involved in Fe-S cluster formation